MTYPIPNPDGANVNSNRRLALRDRFSRISSLFPAGSLRLRIARGTLWTVVGAGLSQSLGLLATIFCARLLGSASYGQLGIVLSTVTLFANVASVGLGVTTTKHVAEYRESNPNLVGRLIGMSFVTSLLVGVAVSVLLGCSSHWLSKAVLHSPGLAIELRIGAVMMLFIAVNNYQTGTLSGFEAFRLLAILNLIEGFAAFPAIIIGVTYFGLPGAVVGYSIAALVGFVANEVAIRRYCTTYKIFISYHIDAKDWKLLWTYSVPVLIASLSFTPAAWWSNTILIRQSGFAEMGLFNAAFLWQAVMMFFSNAISNLGLPLLSAALPEKSISNYKRLLGINFALTTGLTLAIAAPVAVLSTFVMSFYGHQYHGGAVVLRLICLATLLSAMNISVGHAIWSLNAAVSGMFLALVRGLALVCGTYWFAAHGAVGLAWAYVFMGVVQTTIQAPFMAWLLHSQSRKWSVAHLAIE
jgi:O-antigen/teichoic acid export membrane protein